jgi:hypothetical protein
MTFLERERRRRAAGPTLGGNEVEEFFGFGVKIPASRHPGRRRTSRGCVISFIKIPKFLLLRGGFVEHLKLCFHWQKLAAITLATATIPAYLPWPFWA